MKEFLKYFLIVFLTTLLPAIPASNHQKDSGCAPDSFILKDLIPPECYLAETKSRMMVKPLEEKGKQTNLVTMEMKGAAYKLEIALGLAPGVGASFKDLSIPSLPLSKIKTRGGKIEIPEGGMLLMEWFSGAEHIYIGKVKIGNYLFDSNPKYPLTFKIVKDMGYVYLCGCGNVIKEGSEVAHLGFNHKTDDWVRCLTQGNELERQGAAEALGWISDKNAILFLIQALQDKFWEVRRNAAESLGKIGSPEAGDSLFNAVKDENDWVSLVAMEALGKLGISGISYILKYLDEKESKFRESAIYALGASEIDESVPHLAKVLDDESVQLRLTAVKSLERIASSVCVEPLINALNDKKASIRESAINALVKIGDNRAIIPLKRIAAKDPDKNIRKLAKEGLKKMKLEKETDC